jgi:hypothetical protein
MFGNRFVRPAITSDYGTDTLYKQYTRKDVREYYTYLMLCILEKNNICNYMSNETISSQWPVLVYGAACEYIVDPQTNDMGNLIIKRLFALNAQLYTSYTVNQARLSSKIHSPFSWSAPVISRKNARVIDNQTNRMLVL